MIKSLIVGISMLHGKDAFGWIESRQSLFNFLFIGNLLLAPREFRGKLVKRRRVISHRFKVVETQLIPFIIQERQHRALAIRIKTKC